MAKIRTIDAAAKAAGVSVTTIKRALEAGAVTRKKDGSFDPSALRDGIAARAARRGGQPMGGAYSGGIAPALIAIKQAQAQEELELTRAKRMRAQQELAKDAGELILKSDVTRGWAELMMNFRDALLSVGDQVAMRCDGKRAREVAEIIRVAHEGILQSLADGGGRFNREPTR
jgi:phage terminase Nu1 subunit (DNA packaging protein)